MPSLKFGGSKPSVSIISILPCGLMANQIKLIGEFITEFSRKDDAPFTLKDIKSTNETLQAEMVYDWSSLLDYGEKVEEYTKTIYHLLIEVKKPIKLTIRSDGIITLIIPFPKRKPFLDPTPRIRELMKRIAVKPPWTIEFLNVIENEIISEMFYDKVTSFLTREDWPKYVIINDEIEHGFGLIEAFKITLNNRVHRFDDETLYDPKDYWRERTYFSIYRIRTEYVLDIKNTSVQALQQSFESRKSELEFLANAVQMERLYSELRWVIK